MVIHAPQKDSVAAIVREIGLLLRTLHDYDVLQTLALGSGFQLLALILIQFC